MSALSLRQQFVAQVSRTRKAIEQLAIDDSLRVWFEVELQSLLQGQDDQLTDDNAAIRAVRQLQHLVFEHCLKLQNLSFQSPVDSLEESYLSMQARSPANVLAMARDNRFSIEPSLLFNQLSNEQFDPVSPTAKVVGYFRSLDPSLKLAKELSPEDEGRQLLRQAGDLNAETVNLMAHLFQCRYHAVNAAIAATASSQIIELAAGISPRGLQWAQSVPESIYVESDLPGLMQHKAKLIRNLLISRPQANRGLLHCCAADVLDQKNLEEALTSFDTSKPITIVTEGLLLYLSESELDRFLENMNGLLDKHPQATWVTDFVTKNDLRDLLSSHPSVARSVRNVFSMTGRSVIQSNPLTDEGGILAKLEKHRLNAVSQILLTQIAGILPQARSINQSEAESVLGYRKIWSITAA